MPADHLHHVFHAKVELVPGVEQLVPLSGLAAIDPRAYRAALARYDDTPQRRRLRDTMIPVLGRTWTEVVFLSPVHPHAIWRTWRELTGQEFAPVQFWAIPVEALPSPAVIFTRTRSTVGDPIDPNEVAVLDVATFRTALETTPENRDWLAGIAARGAKGAWFNRLPHVLAGAPVSLDAAELTTWDTPQARS